MKLAVKFIFALTLFSLCLTGCKKNDGRKPRASADDAVEDAGIRDTASARDATQKNDGAEEVDLDLSKLSGILVYSEVFNMLVEPEKYVGKTIRIKGLFYCSDDDAQADLSRRVFACIIPDATACCAQGLEFRLKDELTYPDDFPKTNSEITVTGVFFHEEDNFDFFGIKDAVLEI